MNSHWQTLEQPSKLGRVSCSVNLALVKYIPYIPKVYGSSEQELAVKKIISLFRELRENSIDYVKYKCKILQSISLPHELLVLTNTYEL